jgi:Site-specific recombinase XerD
MIVMEDKPFSTFISYLSGRGLSENTIKAFSSDIKEYLEFNGSPVEWLESLKKKGLTNKTLARKRSSLSVYFKFLGIDTELPRIKSEEKLPVVLTEVEAKALLESSTRTRNPNRDRLIVELLLKAGLRLSELLNINASDIEEEQGITFLKVSQGKGAKDRRIPIVDKHLIKSLRSYIKKLDEDERLFNISPRRVQYLIKEIARKAGITKNIHPHTLRHTSATLYLKKGVNIESVRKTLGHSNLSTTQRYLQLTDFDVAEDLERARW